MPRGRTSAGPRIIASSGPALVALVVSMAACGSDSTAAIASNPRPTLGSITPSVINAGSAAATVRLSGQSFVSASRVLLDGTERVARFVNAAALDVHLSANDLAVMDTLLFVVVNPAPGGGSSAALPLVIGYPTPTIASVSPSTFPSGPSNVFLTITGSGFSSRTLVIWDAETAGFVANVMSPTQLRVQIPTFEFPTARTYTIRVHNLSPGGGDSNSLPVIVTASSPTQGSAR